MGYGSRAIQQRWSLSGTDLEGRSENDLYLMLPGAAVQKEDLMYTLHEIHAGIRPEMPEAAELWVALKHDYGHLHFARYGELIPRRANPVADPSAVPFVGDRVKEHLFGQEGILHAIGLCDLGMRYSILPESAAEELSSIEWQLRSIRDDRYRIRLASDIVREREGPLSADEMTPKVYQQLVENEEIEAARALQYRSEYALILEDSLVHVPASLLELREKYPPNQPPIQSDVRGV